MTMSEYLWAGAVVAGVLVGTGFALITKATVDGLAPGVYRWPGLSPLARPGALRDELHRECLEQGLARDAAFVVIGATDVGRAR